MYADASSPLAEEVSLARRSPPRLRMAFLRASARAAADMVVSYWLRVWDVPPVNSVKHRRYYSSIIVHRVQRAPALLQRVSFLLTLTSMSRQDKATTEKHAKTLRELLKRPENKVCADCKRNGASDLL